MHTAREERENGAVATIMADQEAGGFDFTNHSYEQMVCQIDFHENEKRVVHCKSISQSTVLCDSKVAVITVLRNKHFLEFNSYPLISSASYITTGQHPVELIKNHALWFGGILAPRFSINQHFLESN